MQGEREQAQLFFHPSPPIMHLGSPFVIQVPGRLHSSVLLPPLRQVRRQEAPRTRALLPGGLIGTGSRMC